jgi:hypothetical protein
MRVDKCCVPHCRNKSNMTYYEKRICMRCFGKYESIKLKELLKIKE